MVGFQSQVRHIIILIITQFVCYAILVNGMTICSSHCCTFFTLEGKLIAFFQSCLFLLSGTILGSHTKVFQEPLHSKLTKRYLTGTFKQNAVKPYSFASSYSFNCQNEQRLIKIISSIIGNIKMMFLRHCDDQRHNNNYYGYCVFYQYNVLETLFFCHVTFLYFFLESEEIKQEVKQKKLKSIIALQSLLLHQL